MVNTLNTLPLREEESVRMFGLEKAWLSANTYRLPVAGGERVGGSGGIMKCMQCFFWRQDSG